MTNPEHIGTIVPRVLADLRHRWGQTRFEYGSSINHCENGCECKRRIVERRTEYWRDGRMSKLPPPCTAKVA